jgi:hypothetical protein
LLLPHFPGVEEQKQKNKQQQNGQEQTENFTIFIISLERAKIMYYYELTGQKQNVKI